MGTVTKEELSRWFDQGVRQKATHLIVGYDWFDHDNFPIYIKKGESCKDRVDSLLESGNRYDEVYDLRMSKQKQFAEHRAIHIPNDSLKKTDVPVAKAVKPVAEPKNPFRKKRPSARKKS